MSNKIENFERPFNPMEILEPFNPQIKHFESAKDFNLYYTKHAPDFEGKTTQKLNKEYKITGYKLTKKDGKLSLIKDYSHKETTNTTTTNINSYQITERLTTLEQRISFIENYLQSWQHS